MSKERELLLCAVEWMQELVYLWADARDSGDRSLLELIADVNKIEKLLAQPEQEPVGIVRTIGGYPDQSEHTVELICRHGDLRDGDLLYTAPSTREPLSDKEITKNTPKLIHIGERLAFHAGVRFAERHHIIGGGE